VHDLEQTRVHVLARARCGDFAEFVRIYVPLVYKLARGRALDENAVLDVAQEALLDLVRQMPRFRYDPTKQFRHFVRRVVHRRKIDYLRRQREESLESVARERGLACDEVEELSDGSSAQRSSDDRLDSERRRSVLESALDAVRSEVHPSTFRAFELVVMQGASVEEAARALGQTHNQVSQNKHRTLLRVRAKLARVLDGLGDDPA
jgi:RNA polymerase sigma-70 factor (ECF subfamily)